MSTQLAPRESSDLRLVIQGDKIREQLISALPKAYTPEQFTVIVRTAINRNPKLMQCDQSSFLTAMLTAAQMGIAPDGRNGHLIPRFNNKTGKMEANFQPDYKGLVKLVRQNESVADIYGDTVHDADTFEIIKGLHRDLIHKIDIRKPRGGFLGAYAVIAYKDGTSSFDFMSKEEIESIRKRSQSPDFGPWQTDYSEMAKKTVIKRLLKLADLSPETAERISHDPEGLSEIRIAPASIPQQESLPTAHERPQLPEYSEPRGCQNDDQLPGIPTSEQDAQIVPEATPPAPKVLKVGKKAAPKQEPEAPKQESPNASMIEQIREKLSEIGKTDADLVKICVAEKWIKEGSKLEDLSETAQNSILTFWEEITEALS